jgi:phosphatidate cytidylyltransferase
MKRVLTAAALTAFALFSILVAPHWLFLVIVAGMACICYYEYAGIAAATGVEGPLWIGYAGGLLAVWRLETLPAIVLALMAFTLVLADLRKALGFASATTLGILYIFVGWHWAIPLRESSPYWILYALAINWVGDIAAFYVGRAVGRHKLAPNVSPGKSWEGAVASAVAAVLFGVWFGSWAGLRASTLEMAALSVLANAAGQVGDLAESAFKRGAGVKDSSTLLPGHGGFLDRLDSTLFTLPVVYYFIRLISR